ncbi:iron complex outermembrane receptor protein [Sphaerotilus hippei]|uniref:Iron complex outermembrane receptor protein n=1 Tax=Sphaerotilus hippei TaxID=744406 RepID=A0A318GY94_9BURK|nr:TonB-dependent receptor [Sphaerotilus hippei]PXW94708.1 iron complex outermembrane receptor protein [Sphaerotilus hippei]
MPSTCPPRRPSPVPCSLLGALLAASATLAGGAARAQPVTVPSTPAPAAPVADPATAPPQTLERVEIRASRQGADDTEQRRQSSAAKIVIGREEIERMGDSTLGEVLQRLPGVTTEGAPGRGGRVRMRGMGNGYTQILVNGERPPAGFSVEQLTPEQVERIEVLRAPTAEYGAQAIAGTINIVLREDLRQRLNQITLTLGHDSDHGQPELGWNRADQLDALSYQVSGHYAHRTSRQRSSTHSRTVEQDLGTGAETTTFDQIDDSLTQTTSDRLHLGSRLQWRLGPGSSFTLAPFVMLAHSQTLGQERRSRLSGSDGSASDYASALSEGNARYTMGRLQSTWQTRLPQGSRLELRARVHRSLYDAHTERAESDRSASALRSLEDRVSLRDTGWSTGGKLQHALLGDDGEGHELALGWELETDRRDDRRSNIECGSGGSCQSLDTDLGDNQHARVQRSALWAQDEWALNPQWSVMGGLRWEEIRTRSEAGDSRIEHRSAVTTPLLHAVWRPGQRSKDQVRMSLTRSYRAPSLNQLTTSRAIASRYPVGADGTGGNQPGSPDQAGNPDLEPELATGVDLAFEHYLARGGVLSASVFHRRITGLMRSVVTLQDVGYASVQRWVSRPENIGTARTSGIELDGKFRLAELMDEAPPLDLRGNLGLYRSRVDGIDGPDNRIDQQPDWSAQLGADYRLRSLPLTLGGSVTLSSDYAVQLSNSRRSEFDSKRVIDVYGLWRFSPAVQLRVGASNLAPRDYTSGSLVRTIASDGSVRTDRSSGSTAPGLTAWNLRLEMKL